MLTCFFERAMLPEGWRDRVRVVIDGEHIQKVQPDATAGPGDQRAGYAIPGMPNAHSHAFQRGMAGLSERRTSKQDSFWSWREVMYKFLDRMTPEDVEAITAQAFAEMLEGGFTRVGEFHYLHHDVDGRPYADVAEMASRVVAAASRTGIGLTLLPSFYESGDFGGAPSQAGQRRFINTLDRYAELCARCERLLVSLPRSNWGLAPHSLRAVGPDSLAALVDLSGSRPFHIHAAEQIREVEACIAWSGRRPIEWLLEHVELGPRCCVVHATHVERLELAELAASGAAVCLCPLTEASLGDGVFPAADFVSRGGGVGIGTDSNVAIGVAEELRQLEYGQRLTLRQRNVMAGPVGSSTGIALYQSAVGGGSAALGVEPCAIRSGSAADIVSLSPAARCFAGVDADNLLDCWIFGDRRSAIENVWVAGDQVVAEGRHVRAAEIEAGYRAAMRRVLATI